MPTLLQQFKKAFFNSGNISDLFNVSFVAAGNIFMGNSNPRINAVFTASTNILLYSDLVRRVWRKINAFKQSNPEEYNNHIYQHRFRQIAPIIPLILLVIQQCYMSSKKEGDELSSYEDIINYIVLIIFPVSTVAITKAVDRIYARLRDEQLLEQAQQQAIALGLEEPQEHPLLAQAQQICDRIQDLRGEITNLNGQLVAAQEMELQLPYMQQEINNLNGQMAGAQAAKEQAQGLQGEIVNLNGQLAKVRKITTRVRGFQEEITRLKGQLERAVAQAVAEQTQELQKKITDLENQLAVAQATEKQEPELLGKINKLEGMWAQAQQMANEIPQLEENIAVRTTDLEQAQQTANQIPQLGENIVARTTELEQAQQAANELILQLQQQIQALNQQQVPFQLMIGQLALVQQAEVLDNELAPPPAPMPPALNNN